MIIPDGQQRQQAVMTAGHAFVRASAGTGKTHTLTLRALYLLLTAPFQSRAANTDCAGLYTAPDRAQRLRAARAVIRRLVLTTFTRKAAAEMQTRLYEYLDRLAGAPDRETLQTEAAKMNHGQGDDQFVAVVDYVLKQTGDFERLRRGAEALAELATELQVCTLHSFAAAILRRHPVVAGIPPAARFAEEDDVAVADPTEQLVDRWWQHVIADRRLRDQFTRLANTIPIDELRDWLVEIARHPWIAQETDLSAPDRRAVDGLTEATGLLVANLDGAPKNWTGIINAREALRAALLNIQRPKPGAWTELCVALLEHRPTIFSKPTKFTAEAVGKLGSFAPFFRQFEAAYVPARQQCLATDLKDAWETWQSFTRTFADWAEGATVRELNLVTFDEMVRRAARLLRDHEPVRRAERDRLWALLVDEFQDTDPEQLELLRQLLRRDSHRDQEIHGFFVSDPKQSIYRFRDADLPAILDFMDQYHSLVRVKKPEIAHYQLTTSFRSLRPVAEFVNRLFAGPVSLADCDYEKEKLEAMRRDDGPKPAWLVLADDDARDSADARCQRAGWETLRLIQEYIREHAGRETAYSDIVVLVGTHDELDALLPVLDQAGIPAVSSGARTFFARPEVLDILNLLIALYNPHDALAVGALLRSPLFGLSDAQIHQLLARVKTRALFATESPLGADLPEPARERIAEMRRLARDRILQPLGEWLRSVRAFVPDGIYARQDAEGKAVVRIDSVLGAFRRVVELGATAPLPWLLDQRARADKLDSYDAELGEDVTVTDESVSAVRVMTIHKAKGLQGRFVIVYGWQKALDRGQGKLPARRPVAVSLTRKGGVAVRGFSLSWGPLQIESPGYAEAVALDRQYDQEEGNRLAYVAATRAQDRLVLLSHDSDQLHDGILADAAPALLENHQPSVPLFDDSVTVSLARPAAPTGRTAPSEQPVKNPAAYVRLWRQRIEKMAGADQTPLLRRPSQPDHPGEEEDREPDDFVADQIRQARDQAMAAGTLVHAYLERHLQDDRFDGEKLRAFVPLVANVPGYSPAFSRAQAVLERFFAGSIADAESRPYRNRVRQANILGRETPVFLSHEGKAWTGVIDLVLETNGAILGVDYKLAAPKSPLPPEYAQQQRVYTEALRRLFPSRTIQFEFWWLGTTAG